MRVKLYIVTYKHQDLLNETLTSLYGSDYPQDAPIFIVNNHSSPVYVDARPIILQNTFRPDSSTGHLSRNYNEIILHGIKDIREPDCDVLIHCHNDTNFAPDWFSKLLKYHETYSFITQSQGCGFCSYLPEAINEIGLWDERLCSLGYHEGCYMLRAIKYNGSKTSINDGAQRRVWNPLPEVLASKNGNFTNSDHAASFESYSICRQIFEKKWGGVRDVGWSQEQMKNFPDPQIPTYIQYPYFEKYLKNLDVKYFRDIDCFGKLFMEG